MNQWAAGWYPDPEQHGQIRYWDGAAWTEHRQPMPADFGPPQQANDHAAGVAGSGEQAGSTGEGESAATQGAEPTAVYERPASEEGSAEQPVDESTQVRPNADRASDDARWQEAAGASYGYGSSTESGQHGSYGQQDSGSYGAAPGTDNSYGGGYGGYGGPGAPGASGQPGGPAQSPDGPGGKSKALPIAIGVAAVVIIAMIAGLAVWAFSGGDDEQPTASDTSTTTSSTTQPTTAPTTTTEPTSPTTTPGSETSSSLPGRVYAGDWDKKIEGENDAVVNLPPNSTVGLIEAAYEGDSNFVVHGRDNDGQTTGLYVNKIGKTNDVVPFNLGGYSDEATRISIQTTGKWSVTFKSISTVPDFGTMAKGTGSKVLKWSGDSSDVRAAYDPGDARMGSFEVVAVHPDDRFPDRLLSEYKAYEGTTTVQKGTTYLIVTAEGKWSLTKRK
ncbi:DUF2510 domain-containing protein [Janibacter sp. GXQ6167]|uniref:DUF2510 domain-containing protein n=1 Tax=Janibacter sp. GXQ6167 TaxID=3240791 RepID=UPI003523F97B